MSETTKPTLSELKTTQRDRNLSLAKTSLTIGKKWAENSISGIFMSKEKRHQHKQAFLEEQAKYLVDELGKLKGSVVKIGQMLALYGEHMLPDEITKALQTLNDDTATVAWSVIYEALCQQLGDKINDFDIDTTPIGNASLAQVHKATIKQTGETVVLKVQYPGVADAIDSDLAVFKKLLKLTNVVPQTQAFDAWIEEIKSLLHREVDYQLEAETTQRFYQRLSNDNRYVVPKILPEYSTNRVICMSFEEGISLTSPRIQMLSEQRRNAIGQAAIELMMREIFEWGEMQTDPNFGNYLICLSDSPEQADKLVLLDFGAVKLFDKNLLDIASKLLGAGYYHSTQKAYNTMCNSSYDFFNDMSHAVKSDMTDLLLLATEPFSRPSSNPNIPAYCLDDNEHYIWSQSNLHTRLVERSKSAVQSVEFSVPPKEFMFISRKFIGAYTLLTVLDAKTDSSTLVLPFIE